MLAKSVYPLRVITSRVVIMCSRDGTELERTNIVSLTTMDNSLVYTRTYNILQLNTTDDGRVIQCEVVINTSLSVMAANNVTLNVTGQCITTYVPALLQIIHKLMNNPLLLPIQFPFLQSPYHHLVPYKELWWVVLKLSIVQ